MEHMSLIKRRLYFYSFCVIFLVLIPVLIFYANGYRFTKDWGVSETGGIYVYASESNAVISLNGIQKAQSGIFQRGVLLDGLKEGKYEVTVSKDGFSSWEKNLEVKDGYVSEGHPFLIPTSTEVIAVSEFATSSTSSSTQIKNQEYANALLLFSKQIPQKTVATSSPYGENSIRNGNLVISQKGSSIFALWLGDTSSMPYFFCNAVLCDANTSATSTIYMNATSLSHLEFLPGRNDVILVSSPLGIEAVESDTKTPQNIVLIYPTQMADFRVSGNTLYIKEGSKISKMDL